MPVGTCDPATRGEASNELHLAQENGQVLISIRYGWDGTSTRETGCDGPILSIWLRNRLAVTYYARLPNKRRGQKWIEIPAGYDSTLSGGSLRSLGLENLSDALDVQLRLTPAD